MKKRIAETPVGTVRVVIYCRQSVEDTHSEFGSIEAQREAVEAYVLSQRSLGWVTLPEVYNDAGFSGATTDRPAFRRLLADVEAGRVDAIAVYKIDRLSRSIGDFVALSTLFEKHGVTFVSTTQAFSTSTSVGRLTLNLLATFAQFERETIAERTRDKISAARRRGMWTGGPLPLGYDVKDKKLVVNKDEADQVRAIFALYLELGALMATVEELNRRGWRTKSWIANDGKRVPSYEYSKSTMQKLLKRELYIGRVTLGTESYPGAHEAIVESDVWDAVQAQLARKDKRGGVPSGNQFGALLRGLLVCGVCGSSMMHSTTTRGNKRWRYYLCSKAEKQGASACPKSRVAVGEIEPFVVDRIRAIGRDPVLVRETINAARTAREARVPEHQAEVRRQEHERKRLVEERTNLVNAVAGGGPGSATLMQRVGELDHALIAVDERLRAARGELALMATQSIDEDTLRTALADFEPVWETLFPREKERLLALLIERITWVGATGDLKITFRACGVHGLGGRRAAS